MHEIIRIIPPLCPRTPKKERLEKRVSDFIDKSHKMDKIDNMGKKAGEKHISNKYREEIDKELQDVDWVKKNRPGGNFAKGNVFQLDRAVELWRKDGDLLAKMCGRDRVAMEELWEIQYVFDVISGRLRVKYGLAGAEPEEGMNISYALYAKLFTKWDVLVCNLQKQMTGLIMDGVFATAKRAVDSLVRADFDNMDPNKVSRVLNDLGNFISRMNEREGKEDAVPIFNLSMTINNKTNVDASRAKILEFASSNPVFKEQFMKMLVEGEKNTVDGECDEVVVEDEAK